MTASHLDALLSLRDNKRLWSKETIEVSLRQNVPEQEIILVENINEEEKEGDANEGEVDPVRQILQEWEDLGGSDERGRGSRSWGGRKWDRWRWEGFASSWECVRKWILVSTLPREEILYYIGILLPLWAIIEILIPIDYLPVIAKRIIGSLNSSDDYHNILLYNIYAPLGAASSAGFEPVLGWSS
jgi:hypothetical protein